jgi:hypothetical protein
MFTFFLFNYEAFLLHMNSTLFLPSNLLSWNWAISKYYIYSKHVDQQFNMYMLSSKQN